MLNPILRWVLYAICAVLLVNGVRTLVNALRWMRTAAVKADRRIRGLMLFGLLGGILLAVAAVAGYVYDSWAAVLGGLLLAWGVKLLELRYARRTFANPD